MKFVGFAGIEMEIQGREIKVADIFLWPKSDIFPRREHLILSARASGEVIYFPCHKEDTGRNKASPTRRSLKGGEFALRSGGASSSCCWEERVPQRAGDGISQMEMRAVTECWQKNLVMKNRTLLINSGITQHTIGDTHPSQHCLFTCFCRYLELTD